MKISEWLLEMDSHDIARSDEAKADFRKGTGLEPVWPEYTHRQVKKAIIDRGLGGNLKPGPDDLKLANGWEMAEALARKYVNYSGSRAEGRGRRFRDAIAALQENGM
jgi:hypothetical protein